MLCCSECDTDMLCLGRLSMRNVQKLWQIIITVGHVWWRLESIMASQSGESNGVCNLLNAEKQTGKHFLSVNPSAV